MVTPYLLGMVLFGIGLLLLPEKRKGIRTILICVGIAIALVGSIASTVISDKNIPEGLQEVSFISTGYKSIWGQEPIYTDGTKIYTRSKSFKTYFIPGAPMKYTEIEPPEGYCTECMIICNSTFCVKCGKVLRPICPNCEKICDTPYCGKCGACIAGEGE